MFVSPPSPASTSQALPSLLNKKKCSELPTIQEDATSMSNTASQMRKDFVSTPPEYANRARDEIKKRLLHNKKLQQNSRSKNCSDQQSVTSSDNQSIVTSTHSSIFSHPSVLTQSTTNSSIYEDKPRTITLQEALPKVFYDMYSPDILMDPASLLCNGRPKFTKRELLDWDLNDIRSLLIVERLRPEWGYQLPIIEFQPMFSASNGSCAPQFRMQLLPLDSSDEVIIQTLVESDLYLEAHLDYEFKLTSAKYTVGAARQRHEQITGLNEPVMHLSKPEWRNIIENYLLNIAVETQCRFDFKRSCSDYKKWKQEQLLVKKPDMPPPSIIPTQQNRNTSLLKRALLKNTAMKLSHAEEKPVLIKVTLTKEEKAMLWSQCQSQVYQRLGLDWTPDAM